MVFVESPHHNHEIEPTHSPLNLWEELEPLVNNFALYLVRDDLGDANTICEEDPVMLDDFDWGGKVGEASFSTLDSNPVSLLMLRYTVCCLCFLIWRFKFSFMESMLRSCRTSARDRVSCVGAGEAPVISPLSAHMV